MKRFIAILIFVIFVVGTGFFIYKDKSFASQINNIFSYSVCDNPVHYTVGIVDPQFNMSRNEFLQDIKKAEQIWDTAEGKQLFVYDPYSKFSINLTYDQRQSLDTQINQMQDQLHQQDSSLESRIADYNAKVQSFKQKAATLNSQVSYWNSRGGAPQEEYNKLIQQQQELQQEADSLNSMARELNLSTSDYNSQVNTLQQTVDTFNETLKAKPEEGLYNPQQNRIDIYFSINQNELIHTLAHEMGHALGLGHVVDKNAIMYPYTTKQIALSADDLHALTELCRKRSLFEKFSTNLNYIIQKISGK